MQMFAIRLIVKYLCVRLWMRILWLHIIKYDVIKWLNHVYFYFCVHFIFYTIIAFWWSWLTKAVWVVKLVKKQHPMLGSIYIRREPTTSIFSEGCMYWSNYDFQLSKYKVRHFKHLNVSLEFLASHCTLISTTTIQQTAERNWLLLPLVSFLKLWFPLVSSPASVIALRETDKRSVIHCRGVFDQYVLFLPFTVSAVQHL